MKKPQKLSLVELDPGDQLVLKAPPGAKVKVQITAEWDGDKPGNIGIPVRRANGKLEEGGTRPAPVQVVPSKPKEDAANE